MPAKNPRINVVLERPLYNAVQELAEDEGISMSMLMRDLVREAMEIREDRMLAAIAAEREAEFDSRNALGHDDVWS
ncbi:hypothetical protein GMSM_35150 [Geomonas sp. Red276]